MLEDVNACAVKAGEICKGSINAAGHWFLQLQKLLDLYADQVNCDCFCCMAIPGILCFCFLVVSVCLIWQSGGGETAAVPLYGAPKG